MSRLSPLKYVRPAVQAAEDKLGTDIVALDVRRLTSLTDYFLFVTGTSHIHVRTLEDAIRETLAGAGARLQRTDGQRGHLWRVLDYGSLIIHIMDQKTREFYSIERLWNQGKPIKLKPSAKRTRTKEKK